MTVPAAPVIAAVFAVLGFMLNFSLHRIEEGKLIIYDGNDL
jgi:hypothetical protein